MQLNSSIPLPSFNKLTDFVDSNRYTHKEDYQEAFNQQAIVTGSIELDTEMGKVYVDEEALSFQFVNSRGYIAQRLTMKTQI